MYRKVTTDLNFVPREKEILEFWKENSIFEKSVEFRKGAPKYTFFDGPPTANGRPHIGHVETRAIKDLIPRYKSMKGFDVLRKAGWDTHGLPVELEVEKLLGLDGKEQIEAYGIEPFIQECKKSVWKYKSEWEDMSDRVAFWADMKDPYVTYENNYIESEWWALKKIFEAGLLYKGYKIVPYCPRCGTALASHEVAQGYKDVKETSAIGKFFLTDEPDVAVLAWTTTPWTLPSNAGLCVNADAEYVYAKSAKDGKTYILAQALVEKVLGEDAEILKSMKGSDLVGRKYKPLFDMSANFKGKDGYRIISDDYVTLDEGTGIVHIALAFGEDDNRIGTAQNLPFLQLVDASGHMCGGTPFDGLFVKDADKKVLEYLETHGTLFAALPFEHSYPFCWRCDTPLIYYARESWFIRMTAVRDKLIAFNQSINWYPDNIKDGRMGNFLDGVIDWGLSRERYWGTPLPVWTCECGCTHVIGSIEELKKMSTNCPEDIELHKPYIDRVDVICPDCGKVMKRESVVLDCWFDSGSMPFAQWHYPFENKEIFEERYPADFISEAIDQTRGWFYTLLAISTCLFDHAAFKNCVVMGHVQDMEGRKMSKHLGNVINPWEVLDKQGADAVRWYFYASSMPWLPCRFSGEAVSESQRKYIGTLWNTYAFYVLYADIDKFDPTKYRLEDCELSKMDAWILSRLNTLVRTVDENLNAFRITESARVMQDFVDELSNWYVRRSRDRYWGSEETPDKVAAYMTLYTVLKTMALLSAPFTPFMSEQIYQNIIRTVDAEAPVSVHLCDYPAADEARIDASLEENMGRVLNLVTLGRAARNEANMKIRQPLQNMYVQGDGMEADFVSIIAEELNVKNVEFVSDASGFISYKVKPQLRTLGPRYGKMLGAISAHLSENGDAIVVATNNGGVYRTSIQGTDVELTADDILVSSQQKEGMVSASDNGITVVLDTNLNDSLIEEGFARELVSKLQTMRKEAGFEVADHIFVSVRGSEKIEKVLGTYGESILKDVLGEAYSDVLAGYEKEWSINGETVKLTVAKAE